MSSVTLPLVVLEIAPAPKMSSPISFTKFGEFLLDLSRRTSFSLFYKFTNRYMGWYGCKYMQMLRRNHSIHNFNVHFLSNFRDSISHTLSYFSSQNTVPVFCYPYQMVTMMIQRMRPLGIFCHSNNITEVSPIWKMGVLTN